MADKIKRPFKLISGEYTVNEGYITVNDSFIKTNSTVFAQIHRADNSAWYGYDVFPRLSANGSVHLFVRDKDGGYPASGTKITLNIFVGGGYKALLRLISQGFEALQGRCFA